MLKMLLAIGLAFFVIALQASDQQQEQDRIIISNLPEHLAKDVFVGPESEMPIDGRWQLSIEPSSKDGEIRVPSSIAGALRELREALPRWYLNALIRGKGDYDCLVVINNEDLNLLVSIWIEENWELADSSSALNTELRGMGIEDPSMMSQALHGGLCGYLRSDEQAALKIIASFAVSD